MLRKYHLLFTVVIALSLGKSKIEREREKVRKNCKTFPLVSLDSSLVTVEQEGGL